MKLNENIIQYVPTGKKVAISDCFSDEKARKMIEKIDCSDITEEEKNFLRLASKRHIVFNYGNIAEYYAKASKNMQELMEESALVIIDVNDAISKDFVKLCDDLEKIEASQK